MNTRLLALSGLALLLAGCQGGYYHRRVVYVQQPAPVAQPAPTILEEGTVINRMVVAPPPGLHDYVYIGNNWYYWHPTFGTWVHAPRPYNWRPPPDARVYANWTDHPIYHPVALPPTAPPPVAVDAPPPTYVEEGAVVSGVVVSPPPATVDYVFIGGGWYYWHPSVHLWVHAHRPYGWRPPVRVHVYRSWREHPMYHRR